MGPAGEYARREMTAALAQVKIAPPPGAISRYAHAADRLARLRSAWEDAGSPATAVGSREQVTAHPLLAELRLTEASVTQLAEACGIRRRRVGSSTATTGRPTARRRRPGPWLLWLTECAPMTPNDAAARAVAAIAGNGRPAHACRLAIAHVLALDDGFERERWRGLLAESEAALL